MNFESTLEKKPIVVVQIKADLTKNNNTGESAKKDTLIYTKTKNDNTAKLSVQNGVDLEWTDGLLSIANQNLKILLGDAMTNQPTGTWKWCKQDK